MIAGAIKASQIAADSSCQQEHLENIGKKIADFVENNFEDVGCKFATEALKMHYGVSDGDRSRVHVTNPEPLNGYIN